MIIFLIIILICISLYVTYYFNNKLSLQRRQFVILKKQYDELKCKVNKTNNLYSNLKIKYIVPQYTSGSIKFKCNLYLYPLDNAITILNLEKDMFVHVQDCAEINDKLWFEISIPSLDKINSKGWIEGNNIQWISNENDSTSP
ncbi:hypothetical protein [Clostridium lundense]|uniref:hypothetical protein n=1 Tax=Clostridium lundense TaxID=319475 RepID=UPI000484789B|nr:hypothetical protein [Clostridium lundense]